MEFRVLSNAVSESFDLSILNLLSLSQIELSTSAIVSIFWYMHANFKCFHVLQLINKSFLVFLYSKLIYALRVRVFLFGLAFLLSLSLSHLVSYLLKVWVCILKMGFTAIKPIVSDISTFWKYFFVVSKIPWIKAGKMIKFIDLVRKIVVFRIFF